MGYSTHHILPLRNMNGELTETNDPYLEKYLGQTIKLITVGREYRNEIPVWNKTDDGRMIIEYADKFATFEQLDNGKVLHF